MSDADRFLNHAGAIGLLCNVSVHLSNSAESEEWREQIERCVADYCKITGGRWRRTLNLIEYFPPPPTPLHPDDDDGPQAA